jgi:hypothetical protein
MPQLLLEDSDGADVPYLDPIIPAEPPPAGHHTVAAILVWVKNHLPIAAAAHWGFKCDRADFQQPNCLAEGRWQSLQEYRSQWFPKYFLLEIKHRWSLYRRTTNQVEDPCSWSAYTCQILCVSWTIENQCMYFNGWLVPFCNSMLHTYILAKFHIIFLTWSYQLRKEIRWWLCLLQDDFQLC